MDEKQEPQNTEPQTTESQNTKAQIQGIPLANLMYTLVPVFFVFALTRPILSKDGIALSLTDMFSGWAFAFPMLPAFLVALLGGGKWLYRTILTLGLVAIISIPFLEHLSDGALFDMAGNMRDYESTLQALTGTNRPSQFFGAPSWSNAGTFWLIIPALIFFIWGLIASKYQPGKSLVRSLYCYIKAGQFDTTGNLNTKSILFKTSQTTSKVKATLESPDSLKQATQYKHAKPALLGGATIAAIAIIFSLTGSSKPDEDEIVRELNSSLSELGFAMNVSHYEIFDCEDGRDGLSQRCKVNAVAEVFQTKKTRGKQFHVESTLRNESVIFKYEDGFLDYDMSYILDEKAQDKVAMRAMFGSGSFFN
ncbi:hypothetical protein AB4302_17415 [Vibrio breoganii]